MKNDPLDLALIGLLALALALRPLLVALVALVLALAGWRPQRATPAPAGPVLAPVGPVELTPAAPARKRAPRRKAAGSTESAAIRPSTMKKAPVMA
jgi:hypothetical protein